MLELLIITPILGSFILLFTPSNNVYWIRMIALYTSLFTFIISILIWKKTKFNNKIKYFISVNLIG